MCTYPARAIICCHDDSCPPSPPESKKCIFWRYLSCPSVVRNMGVFYQGELINSPPKKTPIFFLPIRMTRPRSRINLFACIFMFAKSTSIKDEDLEETDKIRPQYVWRKDTKDTIGRYIVLLPVEKADSCHHDSEWWRMLGTCTYFCDRWQSEQYWKCFRSW